MLKGESVRIAHEEKLVKGTAHLTVTVDRGVAFEKAKEELDAAAKHVEAVKAREAAQRKAWGIVDDLTSALAKQEFKNSFYLGKEKNKRTRGRADFARLGISTSWPRRRRDPPPQKTLRGITRRPRKVPRPSRCCSRCASRRSRPATRSASRSSAPRRACARSGAETGPRVRGDRSRGAAATTRTSRDRGAAATPGSDARRSNDVQGFKGQLHADRHGGGQTALAGGVRRGRQPVPPRARLRGVLGRVVRLRQTDAEDPLPQDDVAAAHDVQGHPVQAAVQDYGAPRRRRRRRGIERLGAFEMRGVERACSRTSCRNIRGRNDRGVVTTQVVRVIETHEDADADAAAESNVVIKLPKSGYEEIIDVLQGELDDADESDDDDYMALDG